jgi:hypothetical protein
MVTSFRASSLAAYDTWRIGNALGYSPPSETITQYTVHVLSRLLTHAKALRTRAPHRELKSSSPITRGTGDKAATDTVSVFCKEINKLQRVIPEISDALRKLRTTRFASGTGYQTLKPLEYLFSECILLSDLLKSLST